jgi:hypothetical protein
MSIDVYDVDLGKQLGSFKTEAEALRRARLLIDEFGPSYADDLEIGYDDGRPNLTGQALLGRIEQDERSAKRHGTPKRAKPTAATG